MNTSTSNDRAAEIREAYRPCRECGRLPLLKTIAARFKVTAATVHNVINRRTHK